MAEAALFAVASSFGARENCVQRWKEAAKGGAGGDEDDPVEVGDQGGRETGLLSPTRRTHALYRATVYASYQQGCDRVCPELVAGHGVVLVKVGDYCGTCSVILRSLRQTRL